MTKKELTKQLKAITLNYEAIKPEGKQFLNNSHIKKYVDCLNTPDMIAHLLKTGIAEDEAQAEEWLIEFETPKDFIDMFKYSIEEAEENGLIQISEKRKKQYKQILSAGIIDSQSMNGSANIEQIYGKTTFNNGEAFSVTGLDQGAISKAIEKQEALLAKGDLTSLENMLLSQTHTLNAIFTNMVNKMADAKYINQLESYGRIALKAQNQTRQTASTLAEIKGIKKTTFIHQLNQANNQQVNNGAGENLNRTANEKGITHVDRRSEATGEGQNTENKTMALPERDKDSGGFETISPERIQTRYEGERVERIRETISHAEQAGT